MKKEQHKRSNSALHNIFSILAAVILALAFRTFLFEPFTIPSGSMIPTLVVGDYIYVSKYSYGFSKHSFPFGPDIFEGRIFEHHKPERGDVIVFKLNNGSGTIYIKRLVGLPGDKVQVKHGQLFVNSVEYKRKEIGTYFDDKSGKDVKQFAETNLDGKEYKIIKKYNGDGPLDNTDVFAVPEDNYFFMGDNRDDSLDSRTTNVSYIPSENLLGRAEVVFFSSDAAWWQVWKFFPSLKPSRFFNSI